MLLVVLLHAVAAAVVFAGCRARPRLGVALGVGVFATTALVVIVEGVGAGRPPVDSWDWVPDLGLRLALRLDGFAVAEAISREHGPKRPRIVMLTAKGHEKDRRKAEQIGVDDYVTKPFSNRDVVERVRVLLSG